MAITASPSASIYEFNYSTGIFTNVTPGGPTRRRRLAMSTPMNSTWSSCRPGRSCWRTENGGFQIFTEAAASGPQTASRPTITALTQNANGSFTLTGTLLNGISEGSNYGDDLQSASNFPIVQLTDSDGNIVYATTSNWSSTGVATGSTVETTQFTLPSGKPFSDFGGGSLEVIANGIASLPIAIPASPPPT